jgi:ubiquitin C-terminal hydrolase
MVSPSQASKPSPAAAQSSALHHGLENAGSICYANGSLQLLNVIEEFRTGINSASEDPFTGALWKIFTGINSPDGIQEGHLKELLEEYIFPALNGGIKHDDEKFRRGKQEDAHEFMNKCLERLESRDTRLT